jgi:hypothetical protein
MNFFTPGPWISRLLLDPNFLKSKYRLEVSKMLFEFFLRFNYIKI